jgi:CubicO group peptidase (beta-lactamase class C family)
MDSWLKAALDYIPRWIDYQVRMFEQPGCVIALAHKGELVLEQAFGVANLATNEKLTPRHRFRVASHSKSFTAAGVLKLKDMGGLRLDDTAGTYVDGLHADAASAAIQQLLSHSAGLVRDGGDSSYFADQRPFLNAAELKAALAVPQPLPAAERFKYSNHGFALLGLIIEKVTGESYNTWIAREIVQAAGLTETAPDIGGLNGAPLAAGHSTLLPLGRRLVIPGDNVTNDMAAATGFLATAADLVRFFSQLAPKSASTLLSPASRRDMTRRHWRDVDTTLERHYGLGLGCGSIKGWAFFGHGGSFPGTLSRTAVFPAEDVAVSVLGNSIEAPTHIWVDGIAHILSVFRAGGAPSEVVSDWTGRWWGLWGPLDLVAVGDKVLASPAALNPPLAEVSEISVSSRDAGKIVRAPGFNSPGEPARRVRSDSGEVVEVWLGGVRLIGEAAFEKEITARYGGGKKT